MGSKRASRFAWEVQQRIWAGLAAGERVAEIAAAAGVSQSWVFLLKQQAGGVFEPVREYSGRYLSPTDRWEIVRLLEAGHGVREIARLMRRSASTISRELRRNVDLRMGRYVPGRAQQLAQERQRRPKERKLAKCQQLRSHVQTKLAQNWSPEQISGRMEVDFPHDESMRISHETIYQAIYVKPVGEMERLLKADLRSKRDARRQHGRRSRKDTRIPDLVSIHERPDEVKGRKVPGHHEGDLIVGTVVSKSAIGTVVERVTGYTTLVHLPQGKGSDHVIAQLGATLASYPSELLKTLTWDRGTEMAHHSDLTASTGLKVYFADPHSPWQRGTNENTNGLLRQYFPKGTDLSLHTEEHLKFVQDQLNDRPRKRLGFRTPREELTRLLTEDSVATTP